MRLSGKVLKMAWAAPGSLIGLVLSPLFRRRRTTHGVLLCEGAEWPRRLGWPYRAITFGHVILSVDELDEPTLRHELVHVRQFERWGPLFIPLYLLASGLALARGGHHYRDNRFERETRRPARSVPGVRFEVVSR
ncbi:hypothetical protein BH20ACT22_BH20ACT22_10290 [soil metagenome]